MQVRDSEQAALTQKSTLEKTILANKKDKQTVIDSQKEQIQQKQLMIASLEKQVKDLQKNTALLTQQVP